MATYRLEVEPLNLGADVKALGLDLSEPETGEPVRGAEAAQIWSRVLPAAAGSEPWALDFVSHVERVRAYCQSHGIGYRDAAPRSVVIHDPETGRLGALLERFEGETFGARAGSPIAGDSTLENELSRRGVDAYHHSFQNYFFCAVCDFESGSLTLLTNRLWTQEVVRRVAPALRDLDVEVVIPT